MKGLFRPTLPKRATFTRYSQFETTYPYAEPFAGTPYEKKLFEARKTVYPSWMDRGVDGFGSGIGLYRTHRLSKLKANMVRNRDNIPYYIRRMTKGVYHESGRKLIKSGGRIPDPTRVPVLTGHASALTGWVHTEKHLIRRFPTTGPLPGKDDRYFSLLQAHVKSAAGPGDAPMDPEALPEFRASMLYKPYMASAENSEVEKRMSDQSTLQKPPEKRSLRKRLFFMN